MSTSKQMIGAQNKIWNCWQHANKHLIAGWKLEMLMNENAMLKKRVKQMEAKP